MSINVIIGAQWGDEGKGKITDMLAANVDLVVRYQGGNNAGHTVVVKDETFKLHLIPSGILYPGVTCVIASGVVIDPLILFEEIDKLKKRNIEITPKRLRISTTAHVILPYHKELDSKQENEREDNKIGTTGRGIGPAYTDKISRMGLRIQDLLSKDRIKSHLEARSWETILPNSSLKLDVVVQQYYDFGQQLKPYMTDTSLFVNQQIDQGKSVILEGAQGTMLDVDHGTYPYVTSSNPISGGACIGVGLGPQKIEKVLGVTKAYVTRVGEGPFPTEINGSMGEDLRKRGGEYGTTTQRPRRCGWLDLVALEYAIRINGISEICLTKLDVLDGLDEINICTRYQHNNRELIHLPLDKDVFKACQPMYVSLPGWKSDISQLNNFDDLPLNAKNYVRYIEEKIKVPISLISVGSARHQTIRLLNSPQS